MMQSVFAPAKVNLTLHVTGQRADGYHQLDSLVMFASVGDQVTLSPALDLSLSIDGPEAHAISVDGNSILAAARLLGSPRGARINLTKILPVASGIGGGTADAAAAYRGLSNLWGLPDPTTIPDICTHIAQLGADVPVCLFSRTCRMSGVGECLDFLPDLPALNAVLVNPRVEVATPSVFNAIKQKDNPPMPKPPSGTLGVSGFINWLAQQRNDMQAAAISLSPVISEVLSTLEHSNECRLFRMSGSGATCFGLYPDAQSAQEAASYIAQNHPDWWVKPCTLGA